MDQQTPEWVETPVVVLLPRESDSTAKRNQLGPRSEFLNHKNNAELELDGSHIAIINKFQKEEGILQKNGSYIFEDLIVFI